MKKPKVKVPVKKPKVKVPVKKPKVKVCKHCGEPIMKFTWRDEGEQWWHANPANPGHPPGTEHIKAPAYRRCYADPTKPFAEPL